MSTICNNNNITNLEQLIKVSSLNISCFSFDNCFCEYILEQKGMEKTRRKIVEVNSGF